MKNSDKENYKRTIKRTTKKIAEFWVIIFSSMNGCSSRIVVFFGSSSLMFVNSVMESSAPSLEPYSSTPSIAVSDPVLSTVDRTHT